MSRTTSGESGPSSKNASTRNLDRYGWALLRATQGQYYMEPEVREYLEERSADLASHSVEPETASNDDSSTHPSASE